jgi:hypothetical protein
VRHKCGVQNVSTRTLTRSDPLGGSDFVFLNPPIEVGSVELHSPAIPHNRELPVSDHVLDGLGTTTQVRGCLADVEEGLLRACEALQVPLKLCKSFQ